MSSTDPEIPADTNGKPPKLSTDEDFAPLDTLPFEASEGSPSDEPKFPGAEKFAENIKEPSFQALSESTPEQPKHSEPALPQSTPAPSTMDAIRQYAEDTPIGQPQLEPDHPFDLKIEGLLSELEQNKLFGILKENGVPIRTSELEPQFESARVYIPQISEYVGVVIAQGLHAAHLKFSLSPTQQSDSPQMEAASWGNPQSRFKGFGTESTHHADQIPVLKSIDELKQWRPGSEFQPIDVITASAVLRTGAVEARDSIEYQELLDNMQREIRFKAYRKGAHAIVDFSIQLNPLGPPGFYRVTSFGTAIRLSTTE